MQGTTFTTPMPNFIRNFPALATTLILVVAACGTAVAEQPIQSPERIRETVHQFLVERLAGEHSETPQVVVGRLDNRLRLKQCGQPLEAATTGTGRLVGATSVRVHCPGPSPWSIYVSARVTVFDQVLVAARQLTRGDTLTADDIEPARRDLSELSYGYMSNPKEAVGMVVRRRIRPGEALRPNQLTRPNLVERGETVTLTAESGGVQVRMSGKALNDAARGEVVQVRNTVSRRVVEGVVVGRGQVRVRM